MLNKIKPPNSKLIFNNVTLKTNNKTIFAVARGAIAKAILT